MQVGSRLVLTMLMRTASQSLAPLRWSKDLQCSASPRSWLEKLNLRPHPKSTRSKFSQPHKEAQVICMLLSLRSITLRDWKDNIIGLGPLLI